MKDLHEATQEALQNAMTESEAVIQRLQMLQQNNHAMRTLDQREWVGALLDDKQVLHSLLEAVDEKLIELGKLILKEDDEKEQALEDAERYRRLKAWTKAQSPESELGKLLPDDLDVFADSLSRTSQPK